MWTGRNSSRGRVGVSSRSKESVHADADDVNDRVGVVDIVADNVVGDIMSDPVDPLMNVIEKVVVVDIVKIDKVDDVDDSGVLLLVALVAVVDIVVIDK